MSRRAGGSDEGDKGEDDGGPCAPEQELVDRNLGPGLVRCLWTAGATAQVRVCKQGSGTVSPPLHVHPSPLPPPAKSLSLPGTHAGCRASSPMGRVTSWSLALGRGNLDCHPPGCEPRGEAHPLELPWDHSRPEVPWPLWPHRLPGGEPSLEILCPPASLAWGLL